MSETLTLGTFLFLVPVVVVVTGAYASVGLGGGCRIYLPENR